MEDTSAPHPGFLSRLKDGLRGGARADEGPVRTVRVGVNAYGKLPIYKDFISAGLTEPGAREFRNWIDRGFSHRWSSDDACRETEIPRHLFLLRLPESGVFASGCLWGSGDQGGLRRFPFTLFAALPEGHKAAEPLPAAEYLDVMDRQAETIVSRFGANGSLAEFYKTYRGAEVDLPVKPRRRIAGEVRAEAERISISSFAGALCGAEAPVRWPLLLSRLRAAAEQTREDAPRAVRLPLSGALPRAREIQFWLLWLAGAVRRLPPVGILSSVVPAPGRLVLFFRDLRAQDIFLLHPARASYPLVEDLSGRSEEPLAESGPGAPPPPAPLPDDWDTPLASLLSA